MKRLFCRVVLKNNPFLRELGISADADEMFIAQEDIREEVKEEILESPVITKIKKQKNKGLAIETPPEPAKVPEVPSAEPFDRAPDS